MLINLQETLIQLRSSRKSNSFGETENSIQLKPQINLMQVIKAPISFKNINMTNFSTVLHIIFDILKWTEKATKSPTTQ